MSDPTLDNETGCAWREPFALQVLGDSMEPEFPDKSVVIIEQSERCSDGMYVFVEVEGVRWFRQYRVDEDGRQWLIALNSLYPEIELSGLDWKVLGIIIQRNVRRKVKHYRYEVEHDTPEVRISDLTGHT
jgi:SOS-response transcriptional repressor LexA